MKFVRAIFLASCLVALAAPSLPAKAADDTCGCICCVKVPYGGSFVCGDRSGDLQGEAAQSKLACMTDVCGKKPASAAAPEGYMAREECIKKDCWCIDDKTPSFKGQTSTAGECQQVCTDAKLQFGNWNAPPSTTTGAVKCPAGGMWTEEECKAVTDTYDKSVHIGSWEPPDKTYTKGPYCFVAETPVKLGTSIGGLSSATLAQYLAAAYRLGLGVAAILAVLFIMIGGFRYITSAGGGDIEGAKDMIKNAVIGLVLTALSYTLLQTVNPDITSLRLPRVQLVKACNVGVSCSSRTGDNCEKNDSASGMRCIWDKVNSLCYDNSGAESGALGKNGGECQRAGDSFTCTDGSKCITIDSNTHSCSQGKPCQACNIDSDCAPDGGAAGKCDAGSHTCMIQDPNGQAGTYLKCGGKGGACQKDGDCDNAHCNLSTHTCMAANIGTKCVGSGNVADQDACATGSGQTCTQFDYADGVTKKFACCLTTSKDGCLGCTVDDGNIYTGCPTGMRCDLAASKCVSK